MDSETLLKSHKKDLLLLSNEHYYKYIFKKVEKIVCAVFFLLTDTSKSQTRQSTQLSYIESVAESVMKQASGNLSLPEDGCEQNLLIFLRTLIEFESVLRLAVARNYISEANAEVLIFEVESVIRSLDRYLKGGERSKELPQPSAARADASRIANTHEDSPAAKGRREVILECIASKGQVTIRDISSVIKDCSEKTIQRDLKDMIEKSLIKREGKRRWSTYSVL